jgi:hypothetical protein
MSLRTTAARSVRGERWGLYPPTTLCLAGLSRRVPQSPSSYAVFLFPGDLPKTIGDYCPFRTGLRVAGVWSRRTFENDWRTAVRCCR